MKVLDTLLNRLRETENGQFTSDGKTVIERKYGNTGDLFSDVLDQPHKLIRNFEHLNIKEIALIVDSEDVNSYNFFKGQEELVKWVNKNYNNKELLLSNLEAVNSALKYCENKLDLVKIVYLRKVRKEA